MRPAMEVDAVYKIGILVDQSRATGERPAPGSAPRVSSLGFKEEALCRARDSTLEGPDGRNIRLFLLFLGDLANCGKLCL